VEGVKVLVVKVPMVVSDEPISTWETDLPTFIPEVGFYQFRGRSSPFLGFEGLYAGI
jgi:hypothetical protein